MDISQLPSVSGLLVTTYEPVDSLVCLYVLTHIG